MIHRALLNEACEVNKELVCPESFYILAETARDRANRDTRSLWLILLLQNSAVVLVEFGKEFGAVKGALKHSIVLTLNRLNHGVDVGRKPAKSPFVILQARDPAPIVYVKIEEAIIKAVTRMSAFPINSNTSCFARCLEESGIIAAHCVGLFIGLTRDVVEHCSCVR